MSIVFPRVTGTTAAEISDDIRDLIERAQVAPGSLLPPVRALAETLNVNRNTVVAAYRQLAVAGLVESRGRAGTRVLGSRPQPQDGYATGTVLRDVGTGNPDPALIPDPTLALTAAIGKPVLYGEPTIDPDLADWATQWLRPDLPAGIDFRLTVTSGAADAVERLLTPTLVRDDAVGIEDPCFLATIRTVRLGGYRPVAIPIDDQGMTVAGLRAALDDGVRAIIATPRAQNPTGVDLTAERARDLRAVLADHPYVLIIEDDHFSLLSQAPYESLIGPGHQRFALVRSVSKFLGPDMGVAVTASDPDTADRLAMRLSPGTTWVSHLLQRLVAGLVRDDDVMAAVRAAGVHYATRNAAFAAKLNALGIPAQARDGLNLWLETARPANDVAAGLMRRGWLARSGEEFRLSPADAPANALRLTVHDLDDADADALAVAIRDAIAAS